MILVMVRGNVSKEIVMIENIKGTKKNGIAINIYIYILGSSKL